MPALERVVLVGLMGSGKSTVGPLLAEALSWRFVDQDQEVEAQQGISISEIFNREGEAYFRQVESQVAVMLLGETHLVIGSGGGWAAAAGRLSAMPDGTVSVWLRVSAEEAVRRGQNAPGSRPLLAGPGRLDVARMLLEERTPFYRQCDLEVDTEALKPEDVSASILGSLVDRHPEIDAKRLRRLNAQ